MSDNTALFCLKMRASEEVNGKNIHISGAEKIVNEQQLASYTNSLLERGLHHSKGKADYINIKIEKMKRDEVVYLDALPVSTFEVATYQEGRQEIIRALKDLKLENAEQILDCLQDTYGMRGAMLLDVKTLQRLEPDLERGIRATYMDQERGNDVQLVAEKNHYAEAIVLATKVVNCPGIVGEICISDDPEYVTGYVASKEFGYRRITKLKEMGSPNGGRIFLYDGPLTQVQQAIDYLQKTRVIVRGVKALHCERKQPPLKHLADVLDKMKEQNIFRTMKTLDSAQASHVQMDHKDYVMMASNSYLDITTHPYMLQKCREALEKYGFGSGGSRLTTGNTDLHMQLEKRIARFKDCEDAIAFNTGYVANVATISAIMKDGGVIFSDELNHASIIDGCKMSKAKCVIYKHNDMEDLEKKILENPCNMGLVVSDAVFSMDGDILDLPHFLKICKKYDLLSMVDEAHATGVIGTTGHGIVEYYHSIEKPDILMGTLSKSIGSEGGYVAGSELLIQYLRNTARGFIFSTSISPVTAAAAIAGLDIIEREPELVKNLQDNVKYFCQCLREFGINLTSETAIIPIIIGEEEKAMRISQKLLDNGFFISAIRYPTVARGSARLRVAVMASHTREELREAAKQICLF